MSEDLKFQSNKSFQYSDFFNKLRLETEATIQYLNGIEISVKKIEEEMVDKEKLIKDKNFELNYLKLKSEDRQQFEAKNVQNLNKKYEELREKYIEKCIELKSFLEKDKGNELEKHKKVIENKEILLQQLYEEIENKNSEKSIYEKTVCLLLKKVDNLTKIFEVKNLILNKIKNNFQNNENILQKIGKIRKSIQGTINQNNRNQFNESNICFEDLSVNQDLI